VSSNNAYATAFKLLTLGYSVIPSGKELKELFGESKPGLSARDLKLIHEAKKGGGGYIISHEPKG
jgi:hypothetical protein